MLLTFLCVESSHNGKKTSLHHDSTAIKLPPPLNSGRPLKPNLLPPQAVLCFAMTFATTFCQERKMKRVVARISPSMASGVVTETVCWPVTYSPVRGLRI